MVTASGRSRWPHVIGAAILVIAISGGIAYTVTRPDSKSNAAPTSSTPTPTAAASGGSSGSGDDEDDVAPTGCLGGPDRTAAMVLAAKAEAKHTTFGAVEVATAFYRWGWQYPHPVSADADAVSAGIMASTANASFRDLSSAYEGFAEADMTSGQVPASTPFHLSTTNGLWMVSEGSTADKVEVNLAVGYVINGELSPTKAAVISLTMVWEEGAWHLESGGTPDQAKLSNGGTRYTGGC
ncbi:hypothetical protein [Cryobacterium roopkundense]|nr:hypothetical protein [Cryobacterium roopkundense]